MLIYFTHLQDSKSSLVLIIFILQCWHQRQHNMFINLSMETPFVQYSTSLSLMATFSKPQMLPLNMSLSKFWKFWILFYWFFSLPLTSMWKFVGIPLCYHAFLHWSISFPFDTILAGYGISSPYWTIRNWLYQDLYVSLLLHTRLSWAFPLLMTTPPIKDISINSINEH